MSQVEEPTNRLAQVALVVAVVGVVGALTLASLGAVIGSAAVAIGVVARRQEGGRGTVIAGIVIGLVAVVVGVVSTILAAQGGG